MSDDATTRVLWPFAPDWRNSYTVSYEFKTAVFAADDGSEQRSALRSTPRKTIGFKTLVHSDELRTFNRIMDTAQNLITVMPECTMWSETASFIPDGQVSVTLKEAPPLWLVADREVIVADPDGTYTLAKVKSVGARSITFVAPPGPHDAGCLIHPAREGLLGRSTRATRLTTRVAEPEITFNVTPCSEVYDFGAPGPMIEGVEWLQPDHNWRVGLEAEHQWPIGMTDFGRGRIALYRRILFPTAIRTFDLTLASPQPIVELFCRMRGQRGRFVVSSQEDDLLPAGDLGGTTLVARGTDAYYGYRDGPVKVFVEIAAGGQLYARRVTGISLGSDTSVLTLADPLPTIAEDAVTRISWMSYARFASDTLQVSYAASGAATIIVNIKTLPQSIGDGAPLRVTVDSAIRQTPQGDDREVIIL